MILFHTVLKYKLGHINLFTKKMFRVLPSKLHGKGLFSARSYLKNDHIMTLDIDYCFKPIFGDYYGKFMNHSCRPNCCVDGYQVKACRGIGPEEELTFDYSTLKINTNF